MKTEAAKRRFKIKYCQCIVNFGILDIKTAVCKILTNGYSTLVAEAGFEPTTFGL